MAEALTNLISLISVVDKIDLLKDLCIFSLVESLSVLRSHLFLFVSSSGSSSPLPGQLRSTQFLGSKNLSLTDNSLPTVDVRRSICKSKE